MSAKRYWRLLFTGNDPSRAALSEVEMKESGVDQITTSNSNSSGNTVGRDVFYDASLATNDTLFSDTFMLQPLDGSKQGWIAADFGAGNQKLIDQVTVSSTNNSYYSSVLRITDVAIQWSDDGVSWTTTDTYSGLTWVVNETKTFSVTAPPPPPVTRTPPRNSFWL